MFSCLSKAALLALPLLTHAWMPKDKGLFTRGVDPKNRIHSRQIYSQEIRGVNLGAWLILEPWMASNTWSNMGCSGQNSEFDCVNLLGQSQANSVFQQHWSSWITTDDLQAIQNAGLNTIRIPIGYWIYEDIVYTDSEHFPQGGLQYLQNIVGAASDMGLFVILDLHGAPGAQDPQQPFTGQYAPSAGFFQSGEGDNYQFDRATKFLTWITNMIHTDNRFRNVGMLEVVNEPASGFGNLVDTYYPNAWNAIKNEEASLGVSSSNALHIQMMDKRWGSGDPNQNLPSLQNAAYDDHSYFKYDSSITPSRQNYIDATCNFSLVGGNYPLVVGEWSISPANQDDGDLNTNSDGAAEFYGDWFAAQMQAYETQDGWMFWSWKTELGDYRWDYQLALSQGVVSSDLDSMKARQVCGKTYD